MLEGDRVMEPLSAIFMYTKAGHREEKGDEFLYERRKSLAARNEPPQIVQTAQKEPLGRNIQF